MHITLQRICVEFQFLDDTRLGMAEMHSTRAFCVLLHHDIHMIENSRLCLLV